MMLKRTLLYIFIPLLLLAGIDKSRPENNIKYGKFALEEYCKAQNSKLSPMGGLIDTNVFGQIQKSIDDLDKAIKTSALNVLESAYEASQYYSSDTFFIILIFNNIIEGTAHSLCNNPTFRQNITQDYILSIANEILEKNANAISKTSFSREIEYKDKKYGVPYVVKIDTLIKIIPSQTKTGEFKEKKINTVNPFATKQLKEFLTTFNKKNSASLQKVCEKMVKDKLTRFIGEVLNKISTSYKIYLKNKNQCILWKSNYGNVGNVNINNVLYSDNVFNQTIATLFNTGYDMLSSIDEFGNKVREYIAQAQEDKEEIIKETYDKHFGYLNDEYINAFFKKHFEKQNGKINFYYYLEAVPEPKRSEFYSKIKSFLLVFFASPYYYSFGKNGIGGIKAIDEIADLDISSSIRTFLNGRYKELVDLQKIISNRIKNFLDNYTIKKQGKVEFKIKEKVKIFVKDSKINIATSSQILVDDLFGCNQEYLTQFQKDVCAKQVQYFNSLLNSFGTLYLNNYDVVLLLYSIPYVYYNNFIVLEKGTNE